MKHACKYCGQRGLVWAYTRHQGWRLFDGSTMHSCTPGRLEAARRHQRVELPQSAEERYPEQYARYARPDGALTIARQQAFPGHGAQAPVSFDPLPDLPSAPLTGPEVEFDVLA